MAYQRGRGWQIGRQPVANAGDLALQGVVAGQNLGQFCFQVLGCILLSDRGASLVVQQQCTCEHGNGGGGIRFARGRLVKRIGIISRMRRADNKSFPRIKGELDRFMVKVVLIGGITPSQTFHSQPLAVFVS